MKAQGKTTWFVGAALGILLLSTVTSRAVDVTWVASGPDAWNVDENWVDPDGFMVVPDASFDDTAVISNGGTAIVAETVPDVFGLTLSRGLVDIQQDGSLGVVVFAGTGGDTSIGSGGTLRLSGNGKFETGSISGGGLIDLVDKDVSFRVNNDYSASALKLGITNAGNPVVSVGGTARVGGTVVADFAADVQLSFGSSWQFLTANNLIAQNVEIVVPAGATLDRGLQLQVAATNKNAAITVGSLPILIVDRATGQAEIQNVVGDSLTMTGYSIASKLGLLNPQGWNSLADQQVEGWREANPRQQLITELNALSQSTVEVGQTLSLGDAYNGGATHPRDEDVTIEFSRPDGSIVQGLVEYTGPPNDLVLRVDPDSGEAAVQNLSQFTDPFDVTGYRILSASEALSVEGWNSFSDSGAAGEGWVEANPKGSVLAELNLADSHSFNNGTGVNIGSIFTPGSSRDLEFEFANVAGEFLVGTVQYGELIPPLPWDCNGDGVIDVTDANCTSAADINSFLADHGFIAGDLNGDGSVSFPDFLVLSANFGQAGQYTTGDLDKNGAVAFPDFLVLSANFGLSAGAAASAVPEPNSLILLSLAALYLFGRRNRIR